MKPAKLIILIVVAAALCVIAIVAYNRKENAGARAGDGLALGDAVLPDLLSKAGDVRRVNVAKDDKEIVLRQNDKSEWGLENLGGYPADGSKVKRLFIELNDVKVADRLTKNPDKYETFGVADDPGAGGTVEFLAGDGGQVAKLTIGKQREAPEGAAGPMARGGGRYLRLGDDPYVYMTNDSLGWLDTKTTSWVDSEICDVDEDQIMEARVDHGTTQSFTCSWETGKPVITPLPKDKKPKKWEISSVRRALSHMTFSDVAPSGSDEVPALEDPTTFTARARDGTVYVASLHDVDTSQWMTIRARYDEPIFTSEDEATTESLKKAREAADKAKEQYEKFNQKHEPWVYELSNWTYGKLTKRLDDVTEDKPEEKSAPAPTAGAKEKAADE